MQRILVLAIPFFAPIVIGFFAGRLRPQPAGGLAWLNFFVVTVALPPVFFQLISKTPFAELANIRFMVGTFLSSFLAFALAAIGALALGAGRRAAVIAGGIGGYGNVGYMGPGLALAVIGPAAAAPMTLVFTFDSILFFTIIPLLLALGEERARFRDTLRLIAGRVLLSPFLIATALGVLAAYLEFRLPEAIDRSLAFLMGAAAPAALFALGVTVSLRPLRRPPTRLLPALGVKLVLHPLIVWTVLSALGAFEPAWVYAAVLLAALPPALSVFVMASQVDADVEGASSGVLVGTMLSFASLVFWLTLIESGALPLRLFG